MCYNLPFNLQSTTHLLVDAISESIIRLETVDIEHSMDTDDVEESTTTTLDDWDNGYSSGTSGAGKPSPHKMGKRSGVLYMVF